MSCNSSSCPRDESPIYTAGNVQSAHRRAGDEAIFQLGPPRASGLGGERSFRVKIPWTYGGNFAEELNNGHSCVENCRTYPASNRVAECSPEVTDGCPLVAFPQVGQCQDDVPAYQAIVVHLPVGKSHTYVAKWPARQTAGLRPTPAAPEVRRVISRAKSGLRRPREAGGDQMCRRPRTTP